MRTVTGLDSETVIIGYLRKDQLPRSMRPFSDEYLVRIDFPSGAYEPLIDTVLGSLRIVR